MTYIVVLDGEENKTLRVLCKEGLVCLLRLDGCNSSGLLVGDLFDFVKVRNADDGPVDVLLVY